MPCDSPGIALTALKETTYDDRYFVKIISILFDIDLMKYLI